MWQYDYLHITACDGEFYKKPIAIKINGSNLNFIIETARNYSCIFACEQFIVFKILVNDKLLELAYYHEDGELKENIIYDEVKVNLEELEQCLSIL
jgi:hypothetical protein